MSALFGVKLHHDILGNFPMGFSTRNRELLKEWAKDCNLRQAVANIEPYFF
jgi:hypothetical protein